MNRGNHMNHHWRSLSVLMQLVWGQVFARAEVARTPADYVNPLIDTHKSRWFFFSSACRPFGLVNLSPDTRVGGDWLYGYLYGDDQIQCFSHVHGWQL